MINKKAMIAPIEVAVIFLAATITIFYLDNMSNKRLEMQNDYYREIYSEHMLNSAIKYKAGNSSQLELISAYSCDGDEEIKAKINSTIFSLLNYLRRSNTSYILYADGDYDIKVYNNEPNVCINELKPAVFEADTLCGKVKIQLGVWKNSDEVKIC